LQTASRVDSRITGSNPNLFQKISDPPKDILTLYVPGWPFYDHCQEEIEHMEPIAIYDALGGDPTNINPVKDKDKKHSAGLTTAGKFRLHHHGMHVSNSWDFSKIKWGVPIKESPATDDVLYEDPPGQWHSVRKRLKGPHATARNTDIIWELMYIYERIAPNCPAKLPKTWIFNDFGHITWYMVQANAHEAPGSKPKIHN
jgi:hypothetical protein